MRIWQAIALAAILAASVVSSSRAEVELTAQQMRVFGYERLAAGDLDVTIQIAQALLQRDSADPAALLLLAQALGQQQDGPQARTEARLAFRAADDKDTRFSAAMFMADSLATDGFQLASQFWLRKAGQTAPSDEARQIARGAFDKVRSRSPVVLQFGVSIHPSSNVNSGSTATSYTNPGFPWLPPEIPIMGEESALSGMESNINATLTYRLPPTAITRTEFNIGIDHKLVWLSRAAKEMAPLARNSNYTYSNVDMELLRLYRPDPGNVTYSFGAHLGHDWASTADLSDRIRLEASANITLVPSLHGQIGLSVEYQNRLDAAIRSSDVFGLNLGLSKQLSDGDVLQVSLSSRDTNSESPGVTNTALSARIAWNKAQTVAGLGLSAAATAEYRDYPLSPYRPSGGRQDRSLTLSFSFEFPNIEYMGFSPTLDLAASDIKSNVGLYSSRNVEINFGFKSNF